MSEEFTTPEPVERPASRSGRLARGLRGWLLQWVVWDERPTPAQYREACDRLDRSNARVLELEGELAVQTAEADAAKAECKILAQVVKRNEERVRAETAIASADRERAINTAARDHGARSE